MGSFLFNDSIFSLFFLNSFNLKNLFYFWLCWVFIAVCGLSLVAAYGLIAEVASPVAEHDH